MTHQTAGQSMQGVVLREFRRVLAVLVVALSALGLGGGARAAYPERPVKIVVGFPPGGTTDFIARLIAARLTERTGRNFIIENKPGATGTIGTVQVAHAAPDGYTLVFASANTHGINPSVFKNLPYDPVADFAPISLVVDSPNVFVVHPSFAGKSLAEILAMAKEKPGQVAFGSTGHGGSPHMSEVLLESLTGVTLNHVPYKGGGPMLNDLIAGHIQLAVDNLPSSMELIRAGSVRAIAVTSAARSPAAPDVPTVGETVPDYAVSAWWGFLAPAHTPDAVVQYLYRQISEILNEEPIRKRLTDQGATPVGSTPAEFAATIKAEVEKWQHANAAARVRID